MQTGSIEEQLTAFVTSDTALPDQALSIIRASILDWLACGIAGAEEPVANILRQLVTEEGGQGIAALFGGGRAPARAAALMNGTISHALDFDDTHFAHIGHLSVGVLPAAFAIGAAQGAFLSDIAEAGLIGFETALRVGVWLGPGHYDHGFHQTATAGAFGATAAAGRLMGLTAGQMRHAFGLVSTRAAGLRSQFGTMGKPFNAGAAAANGVEAAQLASFGMVSNPDGISAAQGFGQTHQGSADISAFDGLGEVWRSVDNSYKFHACCHGTHAMLEALKTIDLPHPDQVQSLVVRVSPRWARVCNISAPATGLEAKFSYRFCAAMALSGCDTGRRESFADAVCRDPLICRLAERVEIQFDAAIGEMQAQVELISDHGEQAAFADLADPIPHAVLMARLQTKAENLIGVERTENLLVALDGGALNQIEAVMAA